MSGAGDAPPPGLFYQYFNHYAALAKLVEKMLLLKAIVKKNHF